MWTVLHRFMYLKTQSPVGGTVLRSSGNHEEWCLAGGSGSLTGSSWRIIPFPQFPGNCLLSQRHKTNHIYHNLPAPLTRVASATMSSLPWTGTYESAKTLKLILLCPSVRGQRKVTKNKIVWSYKAISKIEMNIQNEERPNSDLCSRKFDNFETLDLCFNKITRDRRWESKSNNHTKWIPKP